MANEDLQKEIKQSRVFKWQIAAKLGVSEMTLIRWLRHELPDAEKERIRTIIAELKAGEANA